jgi:uncharacterized membrane protein
MTDGWPFVLTFIAALGAGLNAGVFFAFSTFVMTALSRLTPMQGITAMQSINVAAISPLFMTALFGTAAICAVLVVVSLSLWGSAGALYALAGSLLYLVGSILVTIVFNVPLNNALASAAADSADGVTLWGRYVPRWTAWNHVRAVAALLAAALFVLALR